MNTTPSDRDGDAWPQEQSAVRRPTRSGRTLRAAGIFAGGAMVGGALRGGANAWAARGGGGGGGPLRRWRERVGVDDVQRLRGQGLRQRRARQRGVGQSRR